MVAAQAANESPNETAGGTVSKDPGESGRLYIDGEAYVEEWSYDGGTYHVTLNATSSTTVYLFPPMKTGESDQGNGESRAIDLDGDSPRQVSIEGGDQLVIITEDFFETSGNPYVVLDGPDPLIGGPWTANDARLSAAGAFTAAVFVIAWKILKQLTGIAREPERVA
ncbi:hypothetical protein [Natrinema marinum]|uniref:hypothetical protein n=1 Tax=Natrinema marinum TaxID=2961598 RepID=UPI0020C9323F|nr:hypothetical protein [Natrinema marinum]